MIAEVLDGARRAPTTARNAAVGSRRCGARVQALVRALPDLSAGRGETAMRCPFCGHDDTQVKDSRPTEDDAAIRRRRFCGNCGQRFTTIERVQLRELTVVKRTAGACRSTATSWRARSGSRCASGRSRRSASSASSTAWCASSKHPAKATSRRKQIGELVMDTLKELDPVAYVRFAIGLPQFPRSQGFRGLRWFIR